MRNKSIIEQTLEVMDRMTVSAEHCAVSKDGKEIAFLFARFYDQYNESTGATHAISGECLPYNQFVKQLKKSRPVSGLQDGADRQRNAQGVCA